VERGRRKRGELSERSSKSFIWRRLQRGRAVLLGEEKKKREKKALVFMSGINFLSGIASISEKKRHQRRKKREESPE